MPLTAPPLAIAKIVRNSSLLMGQCIAFTVQRDAKIRVKRLIFDENINMFFRHFADIIAHDPNKLTKAGDIVLIKRLPKPLSLEILFEVRRVIHACGDITDPMTGKKVTALSYRENMKRINKMYGLAPDSGEPFDYDKAPDRGWQEGKKDFSYKEGYKKWHEFPPGHPLHDDPAAT